MRSWWRRVPGSKGQDILKFSKSHLNMNLPLKKVHLVKLLNFVPKMSRIKNSLICKTYSPVLNFVCH